MQQDQPTTNYQSTNLAKPKKSFWKMELNAATIFVVVLILQLLLPQLIPNKYSLLFGFFSIFAYIIAIIGLIVLIIEFIRKKGSLIIRLVGLALFITYILLNVFINLQILVSLVSDSPNGDKDLKDEITETTKIENDIKSIMSATEIYLSNKKNDFSGDDIEIMNFASGERLYDVLIAARLLPEILMCTSETLGCYYQACVKEKNYIISSYRFNFGYFIAVNGKTDYIYEVPTCETINNYK